MAAAKNSNPDTPRSSGPINPVQSKARARRGMILAFWWGIVLLGLFAVSSGGPPVLLIPVILIGIIVASNTIIVIRGTGPEQQALAPGRLARADAEDDPVAVTASRAPRRNGSDRTRRAGVLHYQRHRLRFTYYETLQSRTTASGSIDPAEEITVFDATPGAIDLGPRPTALRPALDLRIEGTVHIIEFSPQMDLGAGVVGAIVSAAWYDQLLELGAHVGPS